MNCPKVQAHPELRQHVRPLLAVSGAETAAPLKTAKLLGDHPVHSARYAEAIE